MFFSSLDMLFSNHITSMLWSSMILFSACTGNIDDTAKIIDTSSTEEDTRALSKTADWITESIGYATGLSATDINQDGFVDIVLSYGNDMAKGPIEIYLNEQGVLPTSPDWTSYTTDFYGHISTGDINGDGYPDIIASRYIGSSDFSISGGIDIYINQEGSFFATPDQKYDGIYSFGNALGDIDNDGDLDLAIATGEIYTQQEQPVEIWKNEDGYFYPYWQQDVSGYAYDVCFGDVNNDNLVDLLIVQNERPHCWYISNGTTLESTPYWCSESPTSQLGNRCEVGKFNSNDQLDWMISNTDQSNSNLGFVDIWMDGEPVWQSETSDMYSGIAVWKQEEHLEIFISSWWGSIVGYEWENNEFIEFWRSTNHDIVAEELLVFSPTAEVLSISGEGFWAAPSNSIILSVDGGVQTSHEIYATGNWDATVAVSKNPSLFVSNWDPQVGSLGYFPIE
jgi:hypothetical protein